MSIFSFVGEIIDTAGDVVNAIKGGEDDITAGVLTGNIRPPSVAPGWSVQDCLRVIQGASASASQNLRYIVGTQFLSRNDVKTPAPSDDSSVAIVCSFLLNGGINGQCGPQCTEVRRVFDQARQSYEARQFGSTGIRNVDGTVTQVSGVDQPAAAAAVVPTGAGLLSSPVVLVAAGLAVALIATR